MSSSLASQYEGAVRTMSSFEITLKQFTIPECYTKLMLYIYLHRTPFTTMNLLDIFSSVFLRAVLSSE